MKQVLLFLFLFSLSINARSQTFTMQVDNFSRSYIVHLPTSYSASNSYPLVLSLHGYTSNASQQEFYTQMDTVANNQNFIVVYPDGINASWNADFFPPSTTYPDDVKFLSKLMDTLARQFSVNPTRIYACGLSNGGLMSYTLACHIPNRLAAIASVSGTMSTNTYNNCLLTTKLPVLHIHGTLDTVVPYYTGTIGLTSVPQTLNFWIDTNRCSTPGDTVNFANSNLTDRCTAQKISYIHCTGRNEVVHIRIDSGGHTWAGSSLDIPPYGRTNRDISASSEIWKFFNRHTQTSIGGDPINYVPIPLIYPNPFADKFTVESSTTIDKIEVFDLMGQRILEPAIQFDITTVNMKGFSKGMYLLKIWQSGHFIAQRLVKQ